MAPSIILSTKELYSRRSWVGKSFLLMRIASKLMFTHDKFCKWNFVSTIISLRAKTIVIYLYSTDGQKSMIICLLVPASSLLLSFWIKNYSYLFEAKKLKINILVSISSDEYTALILLCWVRCGLGYISCSHHCSRFWRWSAQPITKKHFS